MRIEMLNTAFEITIDTPAPLRYIDSFMSAYAPDPGFGTMITSTVHVTAETQTITSLLGGKKFPVRVPIHVTKHPYWTIEGLQESKASGWLVWQSRQVATNLDGDHLTFLYNPNIGPAAAGEALFHALRGLAIARRSQDPLLHASCISMHGHGIAFAGEVLAGKTTLMTEAVLHSSACPLSNDRIQILSSPEGFVARSWPSYASYCEGTLRNYAPLHKQALRYEEGVFPYKTLSWSKSLTDSFDKTTKRIYPMEWFSSASNKKFVPRAPLDWIVFPRLCHDRDTITVTPANDQTTFLALMKNNAFLGDDPSFKPWHGHLRSYVDDAKAYTGFCHSFLKRGGRAARISLPIAKINALPTVLEALCDR